ncbi:MAG: DNA topoisomerase VI subunit B [Candidatus Nitrosocaldus sp.]|nr:DNA topoisomerase VI subunit B [Candidatus Nitrosocaldus sp.]MDW7999714.1 DNA topoisomerase VI subunit B [Candidatus Nitrosocaldus sp.]
MREVGATGAVMVGVAVEVMTVRMSTFMEISPSEFFYRNRDLAGFSNPTRALYMTVRELVENSLDACDSSGILPEVSVSIREHDDAQGMPDPKQYTVTVRDNGPAIDPEHVPLAFGKVLYGTKFTLRQSRGMFGLGATMAILYGQITTNRPAVIRTVRDGYMHEYVMMLDIQRNKPIILSKSSDARDGRGLEVSITLVGDYSKAQQKVRDYIAQTALITPYADIMLEEPSGSSLSFRRIMDRMPNPPVEVKPHPAGIDVETLRRLIQNEIGSIAMHEAKERLIREVARHGDDLVGTARERWDRLSKDVRTAVSLLIMLDLKVEDMDKVRIDRIDPLAGEVHYTLLLDGEYATARMKDIEPFRSHLLSIAMGDTLLSFLVKNFQRVGASTAKRFLEYAGMDGGKRIGMLSNDEIVRLADAMQRHSGFLPPDATCLSPIGGDALEAGIRSIFKPEFVAVVQRPASAYSGFPFIVEAGIAYGGGIEGKGIRLYRFANKIPLLYDEGSDVAWKVIDEIDWARYKVSADEMPIAIVTHICSTRIPYKTVGKEYIADRPEIEYELKNAIRFLARRLSIHLSRKGNLAMARKRLGLYSRYIPLLARFAMELSRAERAPRYKALLRLGEQYEQELTGMDMEVVDGASVQDGHEGVGSGAVEGANGMDG